jgi:hypothetical protein
MSARSFAGAAVAVLVVGSAFLLAREGSTERDPTEIRTVMVHNECADPVWLFYGREPPVRPEDAVLLAGRASAAQAMLEGDVVWLLAADRSPLDDATVGAKTTDVVVHASCRSIIAVDQP